MYKIIDRYKWIDKEPLNFTFAIFSFVIMALEIILFNVLLIKMGVYLDEFHVKTISIILFVIILVFVNGILYSLLIGNEKETKLLIEKVDSLSKWKKSFVFTLGLLISLIAMLFLPGSFSV